MKWFKNIVLVLLTLILMVFIGLWILLRYPPKDPEFSPQAFATPNFNEVSLPPLKISVIETGFSKAPEAVINFKGDILKNRKLIHAAILVEHPQGSFLIDGGLGRNIKHSMAQAPWLSRCLLNYTPGRPLIENPQIKDLAEGLKFILLTHGHWDHVSGILDFPQVAVRLLPEEMKFMSQAPLPYRHGVFPNQVQKLKNQWVPLELTDPAYENFSKSRDLFGDGSVVVVPLPGHTPGSLGIFVNQAPDTRFLIVGDAVYGVDEWGQPEKKSLLMEFLSDQDTTQARRTRKKLEHLLQHSNEITLVPIHDPPALNKIRAAQGERI